MSKIIFIDFDGTLHDTDPKYIAKLDGLFHLDGEYIWNSYLSLHRQIVHHQYPERHDDTMFHIRLLLSHLNQPFDHAVAADIISRLEQAQEECWQKPQFFPDSLPFLNQIKAKGYTICLATGDYAEEKAKSIEEAAGRKYFTQAFDRARLGVHKGDPKYFRKALSVVNSFPESAISIGDSLAHDIVPAKGLGIKTIWLNRIGNPTPEGSLSPDYEAKDLLLALKWL
jgi:FMN phosphatase YigB (HAD superfamily)